MEPPIAVLVISVNLPYPSFGGMDLRNWQNLNGLTAIAKVGIFGLCSNDPRRASRPPVPLSFQCCSTDPVLSNPPPRDTRIEARAWYTKDLGHPCDYLYSEKAADELSHLMRSFQPQTILLEGIWPHRYIDVIKRYRSRIILDCHNVEAVVAEQIAQSIKGDDLHAKLWRSLIPDRMKALEHEAIKRVDQIWACSENDASLIRKLYSPTARVIVIPNSIDVNRYRNISLERNRVQTERKKTVIFPAAFAYQPNGNAARFLIDKIFPKLSHEFPDLEILLVGRNPTVEMLAAGQREPRIIVTGEVADVCPYLTRASLMFVPLSEGSGTRFKILEAFAAKLPVVSTAKGAEGLGVSDGTHLLLAEDENAFITSARSIWEDEKLADSLADNAFDFVHRHFSWSGAHSGIRQALAELPSTD